MVTSYHNFDSILSRQSVSAEDCQGEWSSFTPSCNEQQCSQPAIEQQSTFNVTIPAAFGGDCPTTTLTQYCPVSPCPAEDCQGEWSSFTPSCSLQKCYEPAIEQQSTFNVTIPAAYGECPTTALTQYCPVPECVPSLYEELSPGTICPFGTEIQTFEECAEAVQNMKDSGELNPEVVFTGYEGVVPGIKARFKQV